MYYCHSSTNLFMPQFYKILNDFIKFFYLFSELSFYLFFKLNALYHFFKKIKIKTHPISTCFFLFISWKNHPCQILYDIYIYIYIYCSSICHLPSSCHWNKSSKVPLTSSAKSTEDIAEDSRVFGADGFQPVRTHSSKSVYRPVITPQEEVPLSNVFYSHSPGYRWSRFDGCPYFSRV